MKKNGQFALLIITLLISITLINSESSLHILDWSSINLDQKPTSIYKHKNFISEASSAYQVSGAVNMHNSQRAYLKKNRSVLTLNIKGKL